MAGATRSPGTTIANLSPASDQDAGLGILFAEGVVILRVHPAQPGRSSAVSGAVT